MDKILIAEVVFHDKNDQHRYDFFTDFVGLEKGVTVAVDTSHGVAIGMLVGLRPFAERSELCSRWVMSAITDESLEHLRERWAKQVADATVAELLG